MWFDSRRSAIHARNGMVATSQPLAAMAGTQVLMAGGNAVDAAVATAATLAVVEPMSTGIGGDLFALVWNAKEKRVRALNGSGRAGENTSLEELVQKGFDMIPEDSPYSVTVPGTVDGWESLLNECGTMGLQDTLKPAIGYAENGFPVSEIISKTWAGSVSKLSKLPSGQEMLVNGRSPQTGEIMYLPELGRTLREISDGGAQGFYTGEVAKKLSHFVEQQGGWVSQKDLAEHSSEWVEPISTNYRGMDIWECPPNGQGLNVLLGLNMLEGFQISDMGAQSADRYHHLIETTRLALADGFKYIADPVKEHVPVPVLLSKDYAQKRAQEIKPDRALEIVHPGQIPSMGNTVYLTVIDKDGNACSLMNSIYRGFGTGLVVPGTGILLHCRGALFSLDPNHPNALAPGKRTFHTIIPSMVTQKDHLVMSFGVMGALQQAQAQLQVLSNMFDFDMEPQQALNALRYRTNPGQATAIEEGISNEVQVELAKRGHDLTLVTGDRRILFGKGQIIARNPETGTLTAGTEPRSDGIAIGW